MGMDMVAPFVGAWIEIAASAQNSANQASLPSWERGLKYALDLPGNCLISVAPFVGAWIEIGAKGKAKSSGKASLPSWERGLKSEDHFWRV